MSILQVIVLAILQGLTEFLPISSSAHLILVPRLTSWPDQGQMFDIAVHIGTLAAVTFYFRKEIARMASDWVKTFTKEEPTADTRLAWGVVIGTIPVAVGGGLISLYDSEEMFREIPTIIVTSVVFGPLLGIAYTMGKRVRDEYTLTLVGALLIGLAQAVALVPGTSRAGITITAALFLGLTGKASARFSFLLSIPVILLLCGHSAIELAEVSDPARWFNVITGGVIAGLTAYTCIYFFLRLIERIGMWPFAGYRLALAGILALLLV